MRSTDLIITPGDPAGIGPEITWQAIRDGAFQKRGAAPLIVGAREPFERLGARLVEVPSLDAWDEMSRQAANTRALHILSAPTRAPASLARARTAPVLAGFQSGWSIQTAVKLVTRRQAAGHAAALVTGPISKERLNLGGFQFAGHTELLAHLCGAQRVRMMLANDQLRITLVTTHLALSDVPRALTTSRLLETVEQTVSHLRAWWGIRRPRVAVAALNPHAGEGGLFGREEIRVISPALASFRRRAGRSCEVVGPLPADTLFANHILAPPARRFDAVVCMYHDQGLIPVKLLDFKQTVNITLGLPIVRTSVDHGVAFDIAGTGQADPSSLRSALRLAMQILQSRRRLKKGNPA